MTYKELLRELHNTSPQPNPRYYHILIDNARLIVTEVALTSSYKVAQDLGFSSLSKFSAIYQVLKEYAND